MPRKLPHRSIGWVYTGAHHIVCVEVVGNLLIHPGRNRQKQCGSTMQQTEGMPLKYIHNNRMLSKKK